MPPEEVGGRSGVTLIEMMVVLVLLGLSFALVVPRALSPSRPPGDDIQGVIDGARRTAVRRAAPVTLSFEADGSWVVGEAASDSGPILAGTLAPPLRSAVRLHISPLGACMLLSTERRPAAYAIDPVRCRLRERQD